MKKLLFFLLPVVLSLLLPGCAAHGETTDFDGIEISVYRPLSDDLRNDGELIRAEKIVLPGDADVLHGAMKAIEENPRSSNLRRCFPEGVEILSYSLEGGELSLEMSKEYLNLQGVAKTIADYCITLTLCALDEVEAVSVFVDGEPKSTGMSMEDVLLYDTDKNPYEKQLRLFFGDSEGRYLASEYHSITMVEDVSLERYVIEELLRGPNDEKLNSVIPEGTRMLSIHTEDGVCTVNLSQELYNGRPETVIDERLTVYSIVNSLTSLSGVDKVRILINGESINSYQYMSLASPLERNEEINGPASGAKGEADFNLYMAANDGMRLAAIPRKVIRDEYLSVEITALQALMDARPEPGYSSLFYEEDVIISAETKDRLCTVVLTEGFFDRRGDKNSVYMAVLAMVSTLTDLNGIEAVKFKIGDDPAKYQDLNLSGHIMRNNEMIIE